MTPEQFRDARQSLRMMRQARRCWPYYSLLRVTIRDFRDLIQERGKDLPEYRAMMSAKSAVRDAQRTSQRLWAKSPKFTPGSFAESMTLKLWEDLIADRRAEYREAREKFIERIGGSE